MEDEEVPFTKEQVAWLKNLMQPTDAPLEEDPSHREKLPGKEKDASSKEGLYVFICGRQSTR